MQIVRLTNLEKFYCTNRAGKGRYYSCVPNVLKLIYYDTYPSVSGAGGSRSGHWRNQLHWWYLRQSFRCSWSIQAPVECVYSILQVSSRREVITHVISLSLSLSFSLSRSGLYIDQYLILQIPEKDQEPMGTQTYACIQTSSQRVYTRWIRNIHQSLQYAPRALVHSPWYFDSWKHTIYIQFI